MIGPITRRSCLVGGGHGLFPVSTSDAQEHTVTALAQRNRLVRERPIKIAKGGPRVCTRNKGRRIRGILSQRDSLRTPCVPKIADACDRNTVRAQITCAGGSASLRRARSRNHSIDSANVFCGVRRPFISAREGSFRRGSTSGSHRRKSREALPPPCEKGVQRSLLTTGIEAANIS